MEKKLVSDFSLGEWNHRLSDARAPQGTLESAVNFYVDADGSIRTRGPVAQKIATALERAEGTFLWSGTLLPGARAMVGSTTTGGQTYLQRFNAAQTALLAAQAANPGPIDSYTVAGNVLLMGCSAPAGGGVYMWGGSLKSDWAGATSTQRTAGSRIVTRAAGGFLANVDVGHIAFGWNGGSDGLAVVQSVDSDTQLTMDRPSPTTALATMTFFNLLGLNLNGSFVQGLVGAAGGRFVWMLGNKLRFTRGANPLDGSARTGEYEARNIHEFPADAQALAVATLRDRMFVMTKAGIYMVGGMAYEIVDGSGNPQHPIEELTSKSIAISQKGIVKWQGALIVPCRDGLYAMDGFGAPVKMSRSVAWAEMVRDGMQPGFATVYKDRYVMPYSYGGQNGTMVFRMDGVETRSSGMIFPKTSFSVPGSPRSYATGPDADQLLAAGASGNGILDCGEVFTIDGPGTDYSGAAQGHDALRTQVVALGDKSLVRRVRARYSALGASDPLVLKCEITEPAAGVYRTKTVTVATANVADSEWIAFDFDLPLECHGCTVSIEVDSGSPWVFVVHALEIHYRAFGGR